MKKILLLFIFLAAFCKTELQAQTDSLPCDSTVYVANTVTPNGDRANDLLLPAFFGMRPHDFEMVIYNRWGQEVFKTTSIQNGWYGEKCEAGVYYWVLKYHYYEKGDLYSCNGTVTLLR